MIEKLREIAAKRTPGTYSVTNCNVIQVKNGDWTTSPPNRDTHEFIAAFANCADEMLAVIEAAEKTSLLSCRYGKNADLGCLDCQLYDAVKSLRKKVSEL